LLLSRSSGLSSNDEIKLPTHYLLIFVHLCNNLASVFQQLLFLRAFPRKSGIVYPSKNVTQRYLRLSFFEVARKRDLAFIAIREPHVPGLRHSRDSILESNHPEHPVEVDWPLVSIEPRKDIHQCPVQLTICLALVPFESLTPVATWI
jgi:hypothetical protein